MLTIYFKENQVALKQSFLINSFQKKGKEGENYFI